MSDLKSEIQFLAGVGPKRAELLNKELDVFTFEDLMMYFPFRYIDRTRFYSIAEITPDLAYVQVKGKILSFQNVPGRGRKRLVARFTDGTNVMELVWFQGAKWVKDTYKPGKEYIVFGRPTIFNRIVNIVHPEIEAGAETENKLKNSLQPVYNTTEELKSKYVNSKAIQKMQYNLLKLLRGKIPETLPAWLLNELRLENINEAIISMHFPQSPQKLQKARLRFKFEELFYIQLSLLKQKAFRQNKFKGYVFSTVGDYFNSFYKNNLPFELTNAQKRVVREIRHDVGSGKHMNRLVQGDVGSGKTLVALMAMLIALDNGFQACLMAPTEILAVQHFNTITKFLDGLSVNIHLLTGSTKKAARKTIHEDLLSGENHLLIGTHALIEDAVEFKNLGLVIVDEQHRFGVAQRAKLWAKNENPPHIMVMTATPIPRTLAMTLYGDLDISAIDEMPPGRKPIQTVHYTDSKRLRMFGFIRDQIKQGRQVYIVYPLIAESEKMDYKDLTDGVESISRAFPAPEYAMSVVHGKMKSEEKEKAMNLFKTGKTHIMVSTTVIEVGVDVPNASVMVIESAERFGLSQLHQLRGRVGRGADQSYCILMTGYNLSDDGKKRIETMVSTTDGFEIAEADLKLRGPGDLEGTQQSGMAFNLKVANLAKDNQILQWARNVAEKILESDPELDKDENQILKRQLMKISSFEQSWGRIS